MFLVFATDVIVDSSLMSLLTVGIKQINSLQVIAGYETLFLCTPTANNSLQTVNVSSISDGLIRILNNITTETGWKRYNDKPKALPTDEGWRLLFIQDYNVCIVQCLSSLITVRMYMLFHSHQLQKLKTNRLSI